VTLRFTSDDGPEPERFDTTADAVQWIKSMTDTGPLVADWQGDTVILRSTYTGRGVIWRLEEVDL